MWSEGKIGGFTESGTWAARVFPMPAKKSLNLLTILVLPASETTPPNILSAEFLLWVPSSEFMVFHDFFTLPSEFEKSAW